jgi:hypothetical protein
MHLNYSADTSLFIGATLLLGGPIAALIVAPLVEARLKLRSLRLDSQSTRGPQQSVFESIRSIQRSARASELKP